MTTPSHERLNETLTENTQVPELVSILKQFEHLDAILYHDIAKALLAASSATLDWVGERFNKKLGDQ